MTIFPALFAVQSCIIVWSSVYECRWTVITTRYIWCCGTWLRRMPLLLLLLTVLLRWRHHQINASRSLSWHSVRIGLVLPVFLMRYSCVVERLWQGLSVCLFVCNGCIVAKRWEIEPRLLLITNEKWHIGFRMTWKSSTLGDLKGQYCNRNCIGCSASFLATAELFVASHIVQRWWKVAKFLFFFIFKN